MSSKDCCQLLRGSVYIGPALAKDGLSYDAAAGWGNTYGNLYGGVPQLAAGASLAMPSGMRALGNAQLSLITKLDTIEGVTSRQVDGDRCSSTILSGVEMKLTLHCASAENLAIALGVASKTLLSSSVVNSIIQVPSYLPPGSLTPLGAALDLNQPVTLQIFNSSTGVLVRTLVVGDDYTLTTGGMVTASGLTFGLNEVLRASYSEQLTTSYVVDTVCQAPFSLRLDARNVAGGSCDPAAAVAAVVYDFYRVKFSPVGDYEILPDNTFSSFELIGKLERVARGSKRPYYSRFNTN